MHARTWQRLCSFLVAITFALGVSPAAPAEAAIGDGRIGSQGGFSASRMMLWGSDQELAWDMDGIASSGARWLRVDFDWPSIQPTPSTWNWQPTDRVVNAAVSRGLQVLAMPAYTPPWARGAGTDDKYPPTDRQTYARFVQEAVRRYKSIGVRHWQIWNEPNQFNAWKPKPDSGAYTDLLRRAYAAAKAEDPGATVIAGGLSPAPDTADGSEVNGVTFARRMYQAGAKGNFDALAMHPYNFPAEPMFPHPDNAFSSTTPGVYQVMVDNGDGGKKVWLTEYGAPTFGSRGVGEQNQADWLVKAYDQVVKWPWAGPLFYYMYRDEGYSSGNYWHDSFGLLRRDWSWKPGMSAFKNTMAKPLTAGPTVGRLGSGQVLNPGSSLSSDDRRYTLTMQNDGNLVLYNPSATPVWSTGTYGNSGAYLVMQNDGNLVLYTSGGVPRWSTGTYGNPGAYLVMQNDGNLVLYNSSGVARWSTGTYGR